jgi:NADPH:quinone reductase
VPLQHVFPLQTTLEWATLAAKPEYYATAWSCLFANLRIRASEVLFVRGGTSALGQAAITIAKLEGVTVFPFEHIPDAHRLMEANGANGKIIVVH